MERRSNPTRRVTSILGLLASEAPRPLTLSAIAKTLGLSLSTSLGILNELREVGYVERHDDSRGYTLGAGVLELGQAARQSKPALGQARTEMLKLYAEFGKVCTVATAVGGQVVVLDRVGDSDNVGQLGVAGSRYPFDAPVGLMFVAWDTDDAVEGWLSRAPIELERSRLRRMRAIISACRQTGYLVERMTEVDVRLHRMLRLVEREPQAVSQAFATAAAIFGERDYLVQELTRATHASVSVICAPAFDTDGHAHLILSMYVLDEHISVRETREMADRLRGACDAVTAVEQGFDPWLGTVKAEV
jgi:DNA-binding IclR family transcriptional regulator